MLTRYLVGRFELVEKLPCRPEFSFFRVFKALTDSFLCIGAGGNVEQKYYIRIQGEEPSVQASFLGERSLFHRNRTYNNSKTSVSQTARRGGKYLVIE